MVLEKPGRATCTINNRKVDTETIPSVFHRRGQYMPVSLFNYGHVCEATLCTIFSVLVDLCFICFSVTFWT